MIIGYFINGIVAFLTLFAYVFAVRPDFQLQLHTYPYIFVLRVAFRQCPAVTGFVVVMLILPSMITISVRATAFRIAITGARAVHCPCPLRALTSASAETTASLSLHRYDRSVTASRGLSLRRHSRAW